MKKFLFPLVVIVIVGVLAVEVYNQLNPTKAKSQRLSCHESVVVFERVYNDQMLKPLQEAIGNGAYTIEMEVEKSVYMPTRLFEYISPEQIYNKVLKSFEAKTQSISEAKNLRIELLVYENDKDDPKKKNEEAKKYAGYLGFRYFLDSVEVYRFQIDFMDMQAKDLDQRIDCAVESVMSL